MMLLDLMTHAGELPPLQEVAPSARHSSSALVAWGVVLLLVAGYELWAVRTGHDTLSQGVRNGPRWFRISVGVGLAALVGHLFVF